MRFSSPNPHRFCRLVRVCLACVTVCTSMLLAALPGRAQDVAAAARQNRARKAHERKIEKHVYTNSDLKRQHILTAEDQARAEANRKNSPAAPANQEQQARNAGKISAPESLGETARRYRKAKEAREAEEALKKQPSTGYPMNVPAPEVAAPRGFVAPNARMMPRGEIRQPFLRERNFGGTPKNFRREFAPPSRPFAPRRISPFQPQPYGAPRIPEAPGGELRLAPIAPMHALGVAPAIPALPPVSAIRGELRAVMVRPGDSWWKLAQEYLGRGSRWQELFALNPGEANPDVLMTGREVLIPAANGSAPSIETTNITVRRGDTLWSIAQTQFGTGTAWTCLANANPEIATPNLILPGQLLRAPKACSTRIRQRRSRRAPSGDSTQVR